LTNVYTHIGLMTMSDTSVARSCLSSVLRSWRRSLTSSASRRRS